ncbi:hypothetical protein BDA96_03G349500 [Sorghum bicolor]|uniref:Uncharacterized protein n=1 Tax=Sorghum bicolor TaxID=4558 RepID=A0A921RGQ3_SORBI|nr:hypothetical protein BDA96_03G349500 [Sorghum bicolor]
MTQAPPPPPPQATQPPPSQPPWTALQLPQPSPRRTPPSAPATATLHPGIVGPFPGNEQPPGMRCPAPLHPALRQRRVLRTCVLARRWDPSSASWISLRLPGVAGSGPYTLQGSVLIA